MNDARDVTLTDPASFGRRLRRIQRMRDRFAKARSLKRLLDLFGAREEHYQGAVIGYRLPGGEWFCRKMAFNSKTQAEIAIRAKRHQTGEDVRGAYQCPKCQKWHSGQRLRNDSTES